MRDSRTPPFTETANVATLFTSRFVETAVSVALQRAGMEVQRYANLLSLVAALHAPKADIALIQDQGVHFVSCLNAMRFRGASAVPIVAVGQGSAEEIASSLRQGASDYAVLGDTMESLVNRVRARLEVARNSEAAPSLRVSSCLLDEASHSLRYGDGQLQLTPREFGLAWVLFEHAGHVVNLQTLSQQVWGRDASVAKRTIEQHVSRLRAKLVTACAGVDDPLKLQAVHNVGYRIVASQRLSQSTAAGRP